MIQIKAPISQACDPMDMAELDVEKLIAILTRLHGERAGVVARKRAARCQRRHQAEWAERWRTVADRLDGLAPADELVAAENRPSASGA